MFFTLSHVIRNYFSYTYKNNNIITVLTVKKGAKHHGQKRWRIKRQGNHGPATAG